MKVSLLVLTVLILFKIDACSQTKDSTKIELIDAFEVINNILGRKRVTDLTAKSEEEQLIRPTLTVIPGFGYSQLKGVALVIESNLSFRTQPQNKVSVIKFVPELTLKKYIVPRVTSNTWFSDNKWNLNTDWRIYKFIAEDFGIGSSTNENLFNHFKFNYLRFHQVLSRAIAPNLLLGMGYNYDYHSGIKLAEKEHITNTLVLGIPTKTTSSGVVLNVLYDSRKNENFPEDKEAFVNISFTQNLTALRSTSNYQSIYGDFRKYFSFTDNKSNVLAIRQLTWITLNGKAPYFDLPNAQGDVQNTTSRPYIEGRFRGNNMVYFESEYRFILTRNELLGAAIFVNSQSFSELTSNKFERINLGYGGSFRMKVNKKSNIYFVASYGFSNSVSRGIFFSLGDIFWDNSKLKSG